MTPRYIEKSFPIVQLNPLSVRERNAFKPIYKMHKWFARRSSSIFRAILLASALPHEDDEGNPIDLMEEFYKGHADDPRLRRDDGTPLKVLDPFMGGGTTVVEALRLGLDVTGIDYNPVAWFIVKGMTTPIDLDELQAAYDRLAGKVKERLLDLYRTRCPVTGDPADIIYGFWVKQGVCVNPTCRQITDLFKSYEVARKRGDASIKYFDVACPECGERFDWELNRCTITAGGLQIAGLKPAGKGRPEERAYQFGIMTKGVVCPHCEAELAATDFRDLPTKEKKKKVELHVVVDPTTGDFFEVRGKLPAEVTAPVSGHSFDPKAGPCAKGKFTCAHCGRQQAIVESADAQGKPLPFRYYGYYAHTPQAGRDRATRAKAEALGLPTNNDKWFAPVSSFDLDKIKAAEEELARLRDELPIPDQEIYDGYNTNRLVIHQYKRWSDLFGPRQLLALGLLLRAISEEEKAELRDALLGAFQIVLGCMSNLAPWNVPMNEVERINASHDYRNHVTIAEVSVWGIKHGRGNYFRSFLQLKNSANTTTSNYDLFKDKSNKITRIKSDNWKKDSSPQLHNSTSASIALDDNLMNIVVTDPPYAGSVQYAEMSDWYYVWLHKVLKDHYEEFEPEITLKSQEIIEDSADKTSAWYFAQLTEAWRECHRVLKDDGLLVFTFHHREGDRWSGLLRSLFDAGFYLVAAYPTHSEALNSIVIQATGGITYDIVHVCRKRLEEVESIPWSLLRKQVQQAARQQLKAIEASSDVLPGPDVWMILLGTALQLFSQHYGQVIDADGSTLELSEAMSRIQTLVREVRGETLPLPGALEDADGLSRVYLLHIAGNTGGWTYDGLHIELRGYSNSTNALKKAGVIRKDKNRKLWIAVTPSERFYERRKDWIKATSASLKLVDRLHLLVGLVEHGEELGPVLWRLERGLKHKEKRAIRELVVEGLRYMAKVYRGDEEMVELCNLTTRIFEQTEPTPETIQGIQGELFTETEEGEECNSAFT